MLTKIYVAIWCHHKQILFTDPYLHMKVMAFWFEFSWNWGGGGDFPILNLYSIHGLALYIIIKNLYISSHLTCWIILKGGGGGPNMWFVLNTCACPLHNYQEFIYFITSYVLNHIEDILIKQYFTPGGKDPFTYLESISVSHEMSPSKIWKCSEARLSVFRIFESFWYLAGISPA